MKWVLCWIQGQSSPSIFKEKNSTFYMFLKFLKIHEKKETTGENYTPQDTGKSVINELIIF